MIPAGQILVRDGANATGAFGHVSACHLEVDATGDRAFVVVDGKELAHLAQNAVEGACLVARARLDRIAVHRVTGPDNRRTLFLHGLDEAGQMFCHVASAKPGDQGEATRFVARVEGCHQRLEVAGGHARSALQANRVLHAAGKLDVGSVGLTGAVPDPDHMARARKPLAGGGIDAGQRLFIL